MKRCCDCKHITNYGACKIDKKIETINFATGSDFDFWQRGDIDKCIHYTHKWWKFWR